MKKSVTRGVRVLCARTARASHARRAWALFHTFCLTARAYSNTQKYGLFCSLGLDQLSECSAVFFILKCYPNRDNEEWSDSLNAFLVLTDTDFARILLLPCCQNYRSQGCCHMITKKITRLFEGRESGDPSVNVGSNIGIQSLIHKIICQSQIRKDIW